MISIISQTNVPDVAALLLSFRRDEGLGRTLSTLYAAGIRKIYLAIDGPRNASDVLIQERISTFAQNFCDERNIQLRTWRREENFGLSLSILTALDWVFRNEDRVIILEDDLEFDVDFVNFARQALSIFEMDEDIWLISGNRFDSHITKQSAISWSTYPMIWGWASWSSRWPKIREAILSSEIHWSRQIPLKVFSFWKTGVRRVNLGILNSWAVPLAAVMHLKEGLCVLPPINLVTNIGVDMKAEHTTKPSWHSNVARGSLPEAVDFAREDRKSVAAETDALFETKVFGISILNTFSYLSSLLVDRFRFPIKARVQPLSIKYNGVKKI